MVKNTTLILSAISLLNVFGCTSASTKLAQENSIRYQSVRDGIDNTLLRALARENYETAKLSLTNDVLQVVVANPTLKDQMNSLLSQQTEVLKQFAMKRDLMLEYAQDIERANALKAVSVDAKLFSDQGILNYFAQTMSDGNKKFWDAWNEATFTYNKVMSEKKTSDNAK